MDENLPIDIHFNKLLDWLISRRHCQQNWQQSSITIREMINAAIQDMPAVEAIASLLQGTYINYFHCLQIVELLKTTEGSSKNIFGSYSSQRLKDWTEILKLYEKDSVFLAEAAQMLSRNVNYEIPALKKQILKCSQLQQEFTRKETEYIRSSQELKEKFNISCKQMGIEGKKVQRELCGLVRNLPQFFDGIVKELNSLQTEIQYYTDFISFALADSNVGNNRLPLIRYILEKGNTTLFEWRFGHPPQLIEELQLDVDIQDDDDDNNERKVDEIDWGNLDEAATECRVDEKLNQLDLADAEIDWTIVDDVATGFEIEIVDDANSLDNISKSGTDETCVARGSDALSLLDHVETRNIFIDELLELEAFFMQRLQEIVCDDGNNVLSSTMFQTAPKSLHVDHDKVETMLNHIQLLIGQLMNPKMKDLFLIRSFPRYVHRLVENLKKLLSDSDKMSSMSRLMVQRREDANKEQKDTEPKLDLIRLKTKELQRQIEKEISIKYKDRRVNIMGEINAI